MGQYDFSYDVPDNILEKCIRHFQLNGPTAVSQALRHCSLDYQDIGYAHYAGLQGDTWNKRALDFSLGGSSGDITVLQQNKRTLIAGLQMMLKPNSTGFLVHDITFFVEENDLDISLPEEKGDTFEVLSEDIRAALEKDQPSLVLDRLHTFSTKLIRDICQKHSIPIAQNNSNYPLHSLVGALVSYYKANDVLESEFTEQAIKMSISIFERFNSIRNDHSYAHDNDILNKIEARYVVKVISAAISLLYEIESTLF